MKKVLVCLFTLTLMSLSAWAGTWTAGNVTVTLEGTTLTLSPIPGTDGVMEDLTQAETLWRTVGNRGNIHSIIVEKGVTNIGAYAFYYCLDITSMEIPVSVTRFGSRAFYSSNGTPVIYYEGTPNEWANIDFTDAYSHPFYGDASAARHMYFYGQKDTETVIIVFTPGITTIKQYAFYYANNITDVNIPHSVTNIGAQAFLHCPKLCRIYVLNTKAPTTGTDVFTGMKHNTTLNSSSWLYLPVGANSSTSAPGFKRKPWYDSDNSGDGASCIGYYGTDISGTTSSFGITNSKVYPTSGTVDGISWSIDNDGVLTLNGTGAITTSFVTSTGNAALYPWWRWHNLITKVVIKGGITGLSNALSRFDALVEIEIQQGTIPTSSSSVPTSSYYILNDQITVRIPIALIDDDRLNVAPWSNMKVTISETAVIEEDVNNLDFLTALHDKLSAPFDMQLIRSVSNAYYNTFCSPIDLDAETVEATFGAGTQIHELASTSYDEEANELTLEFADSQNYMEAGVPYLFKPANSVSNPTFTDVDPTAVATAEGEVNASHVTFFGTLEPVEVTSSQIDAKNFIFLLANNQLTWANGGTLKAMRAYWLLKDGVPSRALSRRPIMRIGQSAQGIEEVSGDWRQETGDGKQVTGRKVLRDGQLIIVHEGVEYNAQGIRL